MSPQDYTIRPMTADDLEQVYALDQRSFPSPWPPGSFDYEVHENEAARMWVVADPNDTIVAMAVFHLLVDEAHLATFAVDEAHRRQRIGYRLMCYSLAALMEEGALSSTLEVRASNVAAHALYRRFGYILVGSRPGYYADGEDAMILELRELDKLHLQTISCFKA